MRIGLALILLAATGAQAATWVLDAAAGNDANAGTATSPWRTWGKFTNKINDGTIHPADTVLFRPGRYTMCDGISPYQSLDGPGGSAGKPITVSVDTSRPGNVEFHGGAQAGVCGIPAWTQARKCTSGPYVDAACNTNAECGGGTCTNMPGVFWTVAAQDNNYNFFGGMVGGVAYQPSTTPGGAPKIYERLYSQSGSAQVKMPTFTPGHAQVMPYPTLPPVWNSTNACTADKTPWLCCTGAGTGTCSNSRIYVQTETGASPSTVGDANFGPVEFPYLPVLFYNANLTTTLQYVTFTNNNNGRLFHFRWSLTNTMVLKNADHLTFEDIDLGYTSRAIAQAHLTSTGVANGSNFPPYNQGDSYQIVGWNATGTNVVRNIAFRRGKIHGTPGNEQIHFLGGPKATHNNITFETLEIGDGPYAVPDGASGTTLTPNAYANQVNKSWPPPGYGAWAGVFPTHWGPLGGGGNTDGQFITTSNGQTIRNCYLHDGGLISFFEGGSGDLLFENNRVDLARMYYGDSGHFPNMLLSYCASSTSCGGLEGRMALAVPTRFSDPSVHGAIIRNNVFENVYANAIRTGSFSDTYPPYKPATPGMIVNNTFHVKGDFRTAASSGLPIIWFWDSLLPSTWSMDAADGSKFQFKNNIIVRDTPSAASLPLLAIDARVAGQVDVDYNNWGGQNGVWKISNTTYTSYSNFKTALQGYMSTSESHSKNADPLFISAFSNMSLQTTSPSYQTGIDLGAVGYSPFNWDFLQMLRPSNQWSMGAYQAGAATPVPQPPTLISVDWIAP
jgi:hypothetical protein